MAEGGRSREGIIEEAVQGRCPTVRDRNVGAREPTRRPAPRIRQRRSQTHADNIMGCQGSREGPRCFQREKKKKKKLIYTQRMTTTLEAKRP